MAGSIAAPTGGTLRVEWPPRPDAFGDEGVAAVLVAELGLDRVGFFYAEMAAERILAEPAVLAAWKALSGELLRRGAIPGAKVTAIVDAASGGYRARPPL